MPEPRIIVEQEREHLAETERTVGNLEARVAALERDLAEEKKKKHTCTGDSCHVVDERIEALQAELDALRVGGSTAEAGEEGEASCPSCDESLNVPAGTKGRVRCGSCKTEFTVKA